MAYAQRYKFVLAQSKDLTSLGELRMARGRSVTVTLNGAGSAAFNYPMDAELSENIWPHSSALKVYRENSRTGEMDLIWSGFINTVDEDVPNNRMTINAVGWLARFDRRWLWDPKTFVDTDDGEIIRQLFAHVSGGADVMAIDSEMGVGINSYIPVTPAGHPVAPTLFWPTGSKPNTPTWVKWGGTQPNEGPGGVTPYVTALRDKRYEKYQYIGPAIHDLTQIENGCDVHVTPDDRRLYVYRKRRKILSDIVFAYGWGPKNLSQFGRNLDGTTVVNSQLTTGLPTAAPAYADDSSFGRDSQLLYGPVEEQVALADVGDTNVLLAYAGAEIILRRHPRQLFALTPFVFTPGSSVPEPFVDYNVGDQVRLVAKRLPRIDVDQQVRIFGINVTIDEEGNERPAALQVYPGG